ncbi:MAG: thiamine pyrophosphate-binding protein [Firmicutes bacterium]|nr:thiamine pyrophosphate-binding protein [Bacillota bacterium]
MERTVAEFVADQLAAWGVEAVYGVPGDAILPFIDAVETHPQLRFYGVKHETAAAFMASASAKLTGKIGVCTATSGPGVANLVNGLADAKNDRAPVLAITGQVETYNFSTNYKQYIDQGMLLGPVTGYSGLVIHEEAADEVTITALRSVVTGRTPAHIGVAADLWSQKIKGKGMVRPFEPFLQTPVQSSPETIAAAINLLNAAERPAILAGRGVGDNGDLLLELAEKWQSGIALTMPAKGRLPGEHPLVMGGLGEGGSEASTAMLNEADTIFMIGATWWPEPYLPFPGRVVQLDILPENIGRNTPVTYGLVGRVEEVLPVIGEGLKPRERPAWYGRLTQLKSDWSKRLAGEKTAAGRPVPPARLVDALERVMANDAVVALDVGDHTVWFNRIFSGTNQTVLVSGNWRSTGFGLPAAIGAQVTAPGRQVIALVGDGGMAQSLAEFSTAVRYRLPVIVVVANNGYLAMEKDRMQLADMAYEVTSLTNPDFAKFAEICGGIGYRVEDSDELDRVLQEAVQCGEPAVVDVLTAAPVFPGLLDQEEKKEKILQKH